MTFEVQKKWFNDKSDDILLVVVVLSEKKWFEKLIKIQMGNWTAAMFSLKIKLFA